MPSGKLAFFSQDIFAICFSHPQSQLSMTIDISALIKTPWASFALGMGVDLIRSLFSSWIRLLKVECELYLCQLHLQCVKPSSRFWWKDCIQFLSLVCFSLQCTASIVFLSISLVTHPTRSREYQFNCVPQLEQLILHLLVSDQLVLHALYKCNDYAIALLDLPFNSLSIN